MICEWLHPLGWDDRKCHSWVVTVLVKLSWKEKQKGEKENTVLKVPKETRLTWKAQNRSESMSGQVAPGAVQDSSLRRPSSEENRGEAMSSQRGVVAIHPSSSQVPFFHVLTFLPTSRNLYVIGWVQKGVLMTLIDRAGHVGEDGRPTKGVATRGGRSGNWEGLGFYFIFNVLVTVKKIF